MRGKKTQGEYIISRVERETFTGMPKAEATAAEAATSVPRQEWATEQAETLTQDIPT